MIYLLINAALILLILILFRYFNLKKIHLENKLQLEKLEKDKLAEIERLRSRFYTNFSHEFRTLLTLITGPLDLLQKNIDQEVLRQNVPLRPYEQFKRILSKENARKHLATIQNNAQLLSRLVNQLLEMADMDTGQLAMRTRPVETISLLKNIVFSFTPHAHNRNLSISFESELETLFLYLDFDKFEIIINNLIYNAITYTPPGGTIKVTAQRKSQTLKIKDKMLDCLDIEVVDTGIGIDTEELKHIFDRFYQVEKESSGDNNSKGIGLSIVKELVELHSGEIKVQSTKGDGTTFNVFFPIGKSHLREEEIVAEYIELTEEQSQFQLAYSEKENSHTRKKEKPDDRPQILLVEDNEEMRFYLRSVLTEFYDVSEAFDGQSGWDIALESVPDIVISDIMMPNIDGMELCQRIKNDTRLNHIPVILLTARAAQDDKIIGLNCGADDYIAKPFNTGELLARVRNILKQRITLQEYFRRDLLVEPREEKIASADEKFIVKARRIVEKNIAKSDYSIEDFASNMALSRFYLNRKMQTIAGMSCSQFIRDIRLRKAAQLITSQKGSISQIALDVGFENFSYFTRCFKEKFQCVPTDYNKNL